MRVSANLHVSCRTFHSILLDMQNDHILKKVDFWAWPHPPKSTQGIGTTPSNYIILFDMFHIYCSSVHMNNFG